MNKVIELLPRKHIYELEHCSGCGDIIAGDYLELGLPSDDNKEIKHIALCSSCEGVYLNAL